MLRVSGLRFPNKRFSEAMLSDAFAKGGFGAVRIPGRKQQMDAHELKGLFHTYLTMAGATLAAPDSDVFEVPERARPYVEALQRTYRTLVPDAGPDDFAVESDGSA